MSEGNIWLLDLSYKDSGYPSWRPKSYLDTWNNLDLISWPWYRIMEASGKYHPVDKATFILYQVFSFHPQASLYQVELHNFVVHRFFFLTSCIWSSFSSSSYFFIFIIINFLVWVSIWSLVNFLTRNTQLQIMKLWITPLREMHLSICGIVPIFFVQSSQSYI